MCLEAGSPYRFRILDDHRKYFSGSDNGNGKGQKKTIPMGGTMFNDADSGISSGG